MADAVNPVTRKERAAQTRLRMIQAAYRLFLDRGYEATTMQDVADAAGVAVQTVYYTFSTKAQLLAEVERFAVLGDRPSTEWRDTKPMIRMETAGTTAELIKAFVAADSEIKARLAPFVAAVGAALPSGPEAVEGRERGRREFFGSFIGRLAELGTLRTGMTAARALDILLAVNSLPVFLELTGQRGWTVRQWQNWLVFTIETQFLA
ncbi:MAG: TetR/AcrR family transcriptional regulator [Mycobacteriales bacterium]